MPAGNFFLRARYIRESNLPYVLMNHASSLYTVLYELDSSCEFLDIEQLETDFERYFINNAQDALAYNKISMNPKNINTYIGHYYFYIIIDLEIMRVQITATLELQEGTSNKINNFSDFTIVGNILWIPYEESSKLKNYFKKSEEILSADLTRIDFTRTNIGLFSINKFVADDPYDMYIWEIFHGVALSFLKPAAIGCEVKIPERLLKINGYQTQEEAYREPERDHLKIFTDASTNAGLFFKYILSTNKIANLKSEYRPECGEPPVIISQQEIEDAQEPDRCRMS